MLIKIQNFSFTKMLLKISSAKWHPSCPGRDELLSLLVYYPTLKHHSSLSRRFHKKFPVSWLLQKFLAPGWQLDQTPFISFIHSINGNLDKAMQIFVKILIYITGVCNVTEVITKAGPNNQYRVYQSTQSSHNTAHMGPVQYRISIGNW